MPARFNHMIVICDDPPASAAFYRDLLEGADAESWGPFTNVAIADDALLQFASPPVEATAVHWAFLCDDDHFDRAYARIIEHGDDHWADPQMSKPGAINTDHGGRGVYLRDPSGNMVELLTRPYIESPFATATP